ncbi:Protein of unknown function [Gryllus bimaculatus]|nr:Protein of unknown function [Gryllus bimaculatus]
MSSLNATKLTTFSFFLSSSIKILRYLKEKLSLEKNERTNCCFVMIVTVDITCTASLHLSHHLQKAHGVVASASWNFTKSEIKMREIAEPKELV